MENNGLTKQRMYGWLALSPLAVFLVTYLASSLVAHDFYKVPIASAFLIASVYAMLITKGAVAERIISQALITVLQD